MEGLTVGLGRHRAMEGRHGLTVGLLARHRAMEGGHGLTAGCHRCTGLLGRH